MSDSIPFPTADQARAATQVKARERDRERTEEDARERQRRDRELAEKTASLLKEMQQGAKESVAEAISKGESYARVHATVDELEPYQRALRALKAQLGALGYEVEQVASSHSKEHYTADDGVWWPEYWTQTVEVRW